MHHPGVCYLRVEAPAASEGSFLVNALSASLSEIGAPPLRERGILCAMRNKEVFGLAGTRTSIKRQYCDTPRPSYSGLSTLHCLRRTEQCNGSGWPRGSR